MTRSIYLDGHWAESHSDELIEIRNPSTEAVLTTVSAGSPRDVDDAVAAARQARAQWAALSAKERAAALRDIAERMRARTDEFVRTLAEDVGVPVKMARRLQVGLPLAILESFADADLLPTETRIDNSVVVREPIGVVGAITPWNYPLHMVIAKVAPALLAGCTVVLKPSEVNPLAVLLLAEVIDETGLPPGVFNLVSGFGPSVGAAMAAHPGIDMVSFTGSTRAGAEVAATAGLTVKRVTLELGGKSPNIIFEDVPDLARVVRSGVGNCYLNSGQTCLALTRMLVHENCYDEAVEIAAEAAAGFVVGDPFDPETKLGPLTSAEQRDRVVGYIDRGVAEGARLVVGGSQPPAGLDRGYYVRPTVFADVRPEMAVAQEEIFGPVLVMLPFRDDEHAVEIANGTRYGLSAGVWSGDTDRAMTIARRLAAGQVDINGAAFNPRAPFGGYKQSGNGRELGSFGLEEFLEVKAIQT
jgi:aldehyde dehydrogenase (NAD+)